jgi:hypothetical protein
MFATLVCLIGIACFPIVTHISGDNNRVTTTFPGGTQQFVGGSGTIIASHSDLSGYWFYFLSEGDTVKVWYDDGTVKTYIIDDIKEYQMKGDNKLMLNLEDEFIYTVPQMYIMDAKPGHLQLQTCLASEDMMIPTWGRLIVTASPYHAKR